ncbi:hypothetical protein [Streptomyces parvus]|uniref:hypothetical protein n=1 Tax=Streptomyces parvus TaxID=66428 RepID=UPI003D7593AC
MGKFDEVHQHRDARALLAVLAVDHSHFRPSTVEDIKEDRVRTALSGSTLIALLIERWNTRSTATPLEGDWAWRTGYGAMPIDDRIAAELTGPVPQPQLPWSATARPTGQAC